MTSKRQTLEQTIEILKTPSAQRAEVQISFLQQETNQIGLFSEYKEDDGDNELHRLCCLYMKHEFFRREETVFRLDDIGTKFYIIISGRVGVLIRMPKARRSELVLESNGNLHHIDQESLQLVKELRAGDSFGELALMKNQRRLASIVCLEDCHFGVIDKKIFNLALKEKEEEKLNTQMRFLANSPLFSRIPKNTIKILHMNSFYVTYIKNQSVFLEGQSPNACYIIKSGEFTIYKRIEGLLKPLENPSETYSSALKSFEIKVCVLSKGEFFGEQEIIGNEGRRTSAVCTSLDGGELMIINRSDLESKILEDAEHKKTFLAYATLKQRQLNTQVESAMSQLMKYQKYLFTKGTKPPTYELDICEKIKNKDISAPPQDIDDLLNGGHDDSADSQQLLIGGVKPAQLQQHYHQMQQLHQQQQLQQQQNLNSQPDKQLYQQHPFLQQNNAQKPVLPISQLHNTNNHQSQLQLYQHQNGLTEIDEKVFESMQHITKNSESQIMAKLFPKKDEEFNGSNPNGSDSIGSNHQTSQTSQESSSFLQSPHSQSVTNNGMNNKIMRIELNSYTNLKTSIRKKTAIALSKQYRQPYQQFMSAGRMYDISYSESQQREIEQQNAQTAAIIASLAANNSTNNYTYQSNPINQNSGNGQLNHNNSRSSLKKQSILGQVDNTLNNSTNGTTEGNENRPFGRSTFFQKNQEGLQVNKNKGFLGIGRIDKSSKTQSTQSSQKKTSKLSRLSRLSLMSQSMSSLSTENLIDPITLPTSFQETQSSIQIFNNNVQQPPVDHKRKQRTSHATTLQTEPLSASSLIVNDEYERMRSQMQAQRLSRILKGSNSGGAVVAVAAAAATVQSEPNQQNNIVDGLNHLGIDPCSSMTASTIPTRIQLTSEKEEILPFHAHRSLSHVKSSPMIRSSGHLLPVQSSMQTSTTSSTNNEKITTATIAQPAGQGNVLQSTAIRQMSQASFLFEKSSKKAPKKVHTRLHHFQQGNSPQLQSISTNIAKPSPSLLLGSLNTISKSTYSFASSSAFFFTGSSNGNNPINTFQTNHNQNSIASPTIEQVLNNNANYAKTSTQFIASNSQIPDANISMPQSGVPAQLIGINSQVNGSSISGFQSPLSPQNQERTRGSLRQTSTSPSLKFNRMIQSENPSILTNQVSGGQTNTINMSEKEGSQMLSPVRNKLSFISGGSGFTMNRENIGNNSQASLQLLNLQGISPMRNSITQRTLNSPKGSLVNNNSSNNLSVGFSSTLMNKNPHNQMHHQKIALGMQIQSPISLKKELAYSQNLKEIDLKPAIQSKNIFSKQKLN